MPPFGFYPPKPPTLFPSTFHLKRMSRRSRKHKKRFICGHRGLGRYCHRCATPAQPQARAAAQPVTHPAQPNQIEQAAQQARLARQIKRQQWQALFAQDGIDLTHLPPKIVIKVRHLIAQLNQGIAYWQLGGKRLHGERHAIKIPVTYRYRLLCSQQGSQITPTQVLSHEAYNSVFRNTKRIRSAFFSRGARDP